MTFNDFKETARLSLPIIVGQIGQLTMSLADNLMVGRVGTDALAAAAIGNALFMLVMVTGLGITLAVTPLTAQAFGAGHHRECGVVMRQGLIVNMASGVILLAVTWGLSLCLPLMNQPLAVVGPARIYTQVLGLSLLPMMLFQTFRQFAEGVSFLKPAMIITLLANLVNVFVNWVFIFGNLGMPAMGLTGAGIATFSSRLFMAAGMMAVVMTAPSLKKFDPSLRYRKIDTALIKRLLKIGIPGAGQYFFEVSAFAGSSVMVGWMGATPLAAHQIALNLASISFMGALGISAAGTIRVGQAMGKNALASARTAGFTAVLLCAGFMATAGIIFVVFRDFLPALYIADTEVIKITATLLVFVAIFQISDGTQAVGLGILRGIPDMKIPTLITLAAYWLVGMPLGYFLAFGLNLGIYGIWLGLLTSLTVSATLMIIRFHSQTRAPQSDTGMKPRPLVG